MPPATYETGADAAIYERDADSDSSIRLERNNRINRRHCCTAHVFSSPAAAAAAAPAAPAEA